MKFDENDDSKKYTGHESIFEDSEVADLLAAKAISPESFDYEAIQDDGLLSKLINILGAFSKTSSKQNKETKKLQKLADNLFKDNEDILMLLNDFGCTMTIQDDYIEFKSERFDMTGKISLNSDKEPEFDDNALKILKSIAFVMENVNHADSRLEDNEKEGFYPVGDLEKQVIMLSGKETEVMKGTLANSSGAVRYVYFYNGKEVTPDE